MQITIYIRKENEEKFKQEKQKSDLINLLLSRHYDYFKPGTLIETLPDDKNFDASIVGNQAAAKALRPRTIGDILGEIKDTERLRDEELEYCQDPTEARRIGNEAKEVIDALWAEYHEIKG